MIPIVYLTTFAVDSKLSSKEIKNKGRVYHIYLKMYHMVGLPIPSPHDTHGLTLTSVNVLPCMAKGTLQIRLSKNFEMERLSWIIQMVPMMESQVSQ